MQNVRSFHQEMSSAVAPARMFKALFVEWKELIPHLDPHGVISMEIIKGNGDAGSIKETTFAEGGQVKTMKHKIEAIDREKLRCKLSLIEGDVLFDRLESAVYEVIIDAAPNGSGCICKLDSHYQPKMAVRLNDRDIDMAKDKPLALFKIIEEHLIANPNLCPLSSSS